MDAKITIIILVVFWSGYALGTTDWFELRAVGRNIILWLARKVDK